MKYKKFGNSDLETSVVGFGGWPMGSGHYGSFDEEQVVAAIHRSIDLGVTLFDTAPVYGWGEGEKLLGKAIAGRREEIVLVSKCGITWEAPGFEQRGGAHGRNSSRESLSKLLDESLARLGTDYLDLLLVHWPDESRPMSEPMEAFVDFHKQGKIRYGGVSNHNPQQMAECLEVFPIITNQVGYHLFDIRTEPEIIPFCRDNGMGIMAYGSLAHGLLTGTMTPETTFEKRRLAQGPASLRPADLRGTALPRQPGEGGQVEGDSCRQGLFGRPTRVGVGGVGAHGLGRAGGHSQARGDGGERRGGGLGTEPGRAGGTEGGCDGVGGAGAASPTHPSSPTPIGEPLHKPLLPWEGV